MNFFRRLLPAFLVASLVLAEAARAAPANRPYKGAIITDAATGKVLFEDNATIVTPPASMAKLMTYAVLFDRLASGSLKLATPVKVTAADTRMGGTQVWLKEGEVFPVDELIHAMLIQSANDAAYALARISAGSVEAFVAMMNAKAKELGMANTIFRTPHGLPPSNRKIAEGDLTTPADFAILSRYLVMQTDVLSYTAIQNRPFGKQQRSQPVMMDNHHSLLGRVDGVDGLKTGFTNGAGFCLSATAQRGTRRVIVVTMGSPTDKTRNLTVAEMIERGFSLIPADSPAFVPDPRSTSVQGAPVSATVIDIGRPASAPTPESSEIRITVPAASPAKKR